jgi:glutamate/tyrosine decarboxylase-like PLP-dependent enzyme
VKDPKTLTNTFSSNPEYYNFSKNDDEQLINFYEYGLQNSRGFRALKVWLTLQQAGKKGYIDSIREDIDLAKYLFNLADNHTHLQAVSRNLSIACIQFKPNELDSRLKDAISFVNELNEKLLDQLQNEGEVFLSNAIINGNYCLRACVVNFRTSKNDIEEIIEIIVARGESLYSDLLNDIKTD